MELSEGLLIAGKVAVTFFLFLYLLLGALWPVNDKETGWIWKASHALVFIIALTLLWYWE